MDILEFIVSNYIIFIVIAIVLLLGLFGYMMDKKKYEEYRKEILNENRSDEVLSSVAEVNNIAEAISVENEVNLDIPDVSNNKDA